MRTGVVHNFKIMGSIKKIIWVWVQSPEELTAIGMEVLVGESATTPLMAAQGITKEWGGGITQPSGMECKRSLN